MTLPAAVVFGVLRSCQQTVPGVLFNWAPECPAACQMAKLAPVGSRMIAMRPWSATSIGPRQTVPPAILAFRAVRAALLTETYGSQNGGAFSFLCSSDIG